MFSYAPHPALYQMVPSFYEFHNATIHQKWYHGQPTMSAQLAVKAVA